MFKNVDVDDRPRTKCLIFDMFVYLDGPLTWGYGIWIIENGSSPKIDESGFTKLLVIVWEDFFGEEKFISVTWGFEQFQ